MTQIVPRRAQRCCGRAMSGWGGRARVDTASPGVQAPLLLAIRAPQATAVASRRRAGSAVPEKMGHEIGRDVQPAGFGAAMRRSLAAMRALDRRLTRRDGLRRVLFNGRTPMNYAIVAPLHRAMRTDSRIECYFTSTESPGRAAEVFREAGPDARLVSPRRAALTRFDAYVAADLLWLTLPRGAPRVQMFHGVAGKYAHDYDRPTRSMREWDRHFFVNERRMRNFSAAGALEPQSARLIGMPKVDCLVDGSLDRRTVLDRLGLDAALPTVLYAPTWSAASSLVKFGAEFVRRLTDGPWNVIVKLHDRLRDPQPFFSGGKDWGEELGPHLSGPRARLATGGDVCPSLVAADIMITDHSSAGFEYLLLDRPLVRFDLPELIRTSNTNPEYVDLLRSASVSVSTPSQALRAIERSLENPHHLSAARVAVAQDLFFRPGTATLRAVSELYALMELDGPPLDSPRMEPPCAWTSSCPPTTVPPSSRERSTACSLPKSLPD